MRNIRVILHKNRDRQANGTHVDELSIDIDLTEAVVSRLVFFCTLSKYHS